MSTGKRKKRSKKKSSTSTGTRSSTGLSPEVKKSKNQDETEDEVFQVLNMAADVASKLQCITDKLDKLGPIEEKIDKLTSSIQAVENKIFKLDKDVADLKAKYIQIDEGLNNMNLDVEELKEWRTRTEDDQYDSNRELMDDLETIKQNILYAEAYSRRENLKFVGIREDEKENTKDVLIGFLESEVGLDTAKDIEFQRVHRNGKGSPRTIIARFLRYTDCERVLRSAKNLKGKRFAIYQDFPKPILDRRKQLMSALKVARKQGKKAAFSKSQPDKLFIEGKQYFPSTFSAGYPP